MPSGEQWRLESDSQVSEFDEVAITVGHEGWRRMTDADHPSTPRMIAAFPTEPHLNSGKILAGSTVAIRGFGLTAIDVALALTEGRDGQFIEHTNGYGYRRSGDEPARILPFSRSGKPMLAKPDESRFFLPQQAEAVWEAGRETIRSMERPIGCYDLTHVLFRTVTFSAAVATNLFRGPFVTPFSAASVEAWFAHWCRPAIAPHATRALMQQSFAVATGRATPDVAWGLGIAWRKLYPAIVEVISHGGLTEEAWPTFHRIATEMERLAFGPPAENVGRMLALIDACLIDLTFITGQLRHSLRSERHRSHLELGGSKFAQGYAAKQCEVDHCVDAVIPSPTQFRPAGPIQALVDEGIIEVIDNQGINIDAAGRPSIRNGFRETKRCQGNGLAIFGRSTEGCVLGNDTLSRMLHEHPQRWAKQVLQSIETRKLAR